MTAKNKWLQKIGGRALPTPPLNFPLKNDISTKIVKLNADFFGNFICKNFNYCFKKGEFPYVLKHADVVPVHKKEIKSDKANYRPVNILPNLSKVYEKLMYQQLYKYFNSTLSPKQCGFRKGYSVQYFQKNSKNRGTREKNLGPFSLTFLKHSIA